MQTVYHACIAGAAVTLVVFMGCCDVGEDLELFCSYHLAMLADLLLPVFALLSRSWEHLLAQAQRPCLNLELLPAWCRNRRVHLRWSCAGIPGGWLLVSLKTTPWKST